MLVSVVETDWLSEPEQDTEAMLDSEAVPEKLGVGSGRAMLQKNEST